MVSKMIKCSVCGEEISDDPEDLYKCYRCGKEDLCEDCIYECTECENVFCKECTLEFDNVENVCKNCIDKLYPREKEIAEVIKTVEVIKEVPIIKGFDLNESIL